MLNLEAQLLYVLKIQYDGALIEDGMMLEVFLAE